MSTKVKPLGKIIVILLIVAGLFAAKIFWWDKNHPEAATATWGGGNAKQTHETHTLYLKLAGSNTIGDSLAPALVRGYLASLNATDIRTTAPEKDEKEVSGTLNGEKIYIGISAHGTATGFKALDGNTADICMASAPVDDNTFQLFSGKANSEDMRSVSNEHVIGLDGIAVIVNAGNKVDELSLDQLRKIFTGEVSNWSDLPGAGKSGAIHIYRRDNNSGTFKMFSEMALNKQPIKADAKTYEKSEELVQHVGSDPDGIGFVSYTFVSSQGIRPVAVKGGESLPAIVPNALSIQTEKYPLCRRLFFYVLRNSTNNHILPFIKFTESAAGQHIVENGGFINLTINNDKPEGMAGDPAAYKSLLSGSKKLSTEFRFRFGSPDLDTRAVADVTRLVDYMSQPANRNKKIVLVGFTDNVGKADKNIVLSKERAHSVQKELEKQSIPVKDVMGLGAARPVHNNDNEMERSFNRRVEVWVTE